MKRNYLVFMLLMFVGLCTTSCKQFETPAEADVIGVGYIQYDGGFYFVEIDSVKYAPTYVYTNSNSRDGKNTMKAVEGMLVTCFQLNGNSNVEFIAGIHEQEYLEEYFTTNSTGAVAFGIFFIVGVAVILMDNKVKRTSVHAD